MYSKEFWAKVAERALKSAAQAVVGLIVVDGTNAFDAVHADWSTAGSFALGAAVLSVLTSLITSGAGPKDDPSAV